MVIWSKTENMRKNSWLLNYQQAVFFIVDERACFTRHTRAQATKILWKKLHKNKCTMVSESYVSSCFF